MSCVVSWNDAIPDDLYIVHVVVALNEAVDRGGGDADDDDSTVTAVHAVAVMDLQDAVMVVILFYLPYCVLLGSQQQHLVVMFEVINDSVIP